MDSQTIIIIALLIFFFVFPFLLLKLITRTDSSSITLRYSTEDAPTTVASQEPKLDVSKAEILNEMCTVLGHRMVARLGADRGLSQGEINILVYKAQLFHSGAFRVIDSASEEEINKWLDHPGIKNSTWPDPFIMNMAAHTPIPTKMMEKMMKKLLEGYYEGYYEEVFEKAKAKILKYRSDISSGLKYLHGSDTPI